MAVEAATLELVRAEAPAAEQARALTGPTLEALVDDGLMRALVPASLGGGEMHPREFQEAVEELAIADAAAGWCLAVEATAGLVAAYLPEHAAAEVAGDPRGVHAGVFAPRGKAALDGDRLRIAGRWPLCSGVGGADWIGLGCLDGDGAYLYVLLPVGEVEVIDTWDSLGLRGTGSHDVAVTAGEVPLARSARLIGGEPREPGPLYRFPLFGLLAISIAGVCTGIARAALDHVGSSVSERKPAGSTRTMAERATTQERIATAEGSLRAARALVGEAIDAAWRQASAGEPLDVERRLGLRLAASHAARVAVAVVDSAHALGGSSSIYRGNELEKRLRDVHTASQHMLVAPATLELEGRLLLGLETDVAQL